MKIAIIIDSAVGLTKQQCEKKGWYFLPLFFSIDNKEYADGIDEKTKDLYQILKPDSDVNTSCTPVGEAVKLVESIYDKYDKIVIYPISEKLSSQYNNLLSTLSSYKKVRVVKSKKLTLLTALDLLNFEKNIANNMKFDKAVDILEDDLNLKFLLIPKFNDALVRGGRLTPAAATVAKLLKIVPIIKLENGELKKEGVGRLFRKSITKYFKELHTQYPEHIPFVIHSNNKEIEEIKLEMQAISGQEINIFNIPNVIGIHTGIEAIAFTKLPIDSERIQELYDLFEIKRS
ncbi:DegV family protein [Mycoplasma iguanae]|uniref:DegV family protein n=1 Tax=Mycoplasma iguanae TaxID=292461 RepID=A0ABY5R7W3_9MOLU|nr:DegV family protein [Mycoplasma iguanae]UVD81573.1 DegV family protein [Mycoplasma iguanae]